VEKIPQKIKKFGGKNIKVEKIKIK